MNETSKLQHLADWDACEAGELRRVVWQMKSRRRNQNIVRIGGLAVILLLCAFAGTLIWQQFNASDRFDYGGITCKEVQDQMADYSRGKVSPKLAHQIRIHLSKCPNCRALEQPALSFARSF